MRRRKIIKINNIILVCGLFMCSALKGQERGRLSEESKVPDMKFRVLNGKKSTINLSDYKGKVVILDFWSTICTACIGKMPYLDSLQKKNADKVKIVLVSRDDLTGDSTKVDYFFKRFTKKHPGFELPSVINDSLAARYFPHMTIPHYVWIDKNGIFKAATNGDDINEENLEKVFNGQTINYAHKWEDLDFKDNVPLFSKGNGGNERNVVVKSLLASYMDGVPSGIYRDSRNLDSISMFYIRNMDLLRLFKEAYGIPRSYPLSRIVLNVKDESKFIKPDTMTGNQWMKHSRYCYELTIRPTNITNIRKKMQEDFYTAFHIRGKREMRRVECLIIKDNPARKTAKKRNATAEESDVLFTIRDIASRLNEKGRVPVILEVSKTDDLFITLTDKEKEDMDTLKRKLQSEGYELVKEMREVMLFILDEN